MRLPLLCSTLVPLVLGFRVIDARTIAIENVTLISMTSDHAEPGRTVIIEDGVIRSIGAGGDHSGAADSQESIDGSGKFLIPGLWDLHVHLSFWGEPEVAGGATRDTVADPEAYGEVLPLFIAWGVTGVRDMGGDLDAIDLWRARIDAGEIVGPRIVRCGPYVDGPKPNDKYRVFVETAQEARETIDALHARGVDFIKVHTRVPPEAYRAIGERSNELGLPLAGHLPYGTRFEHAVEAGHDVIEHTTSLLVSQKKDPHSTLVKDWRASYRWYSSKGAKTWIERYASRGGALVATLVTKDGHIARQTDFGEWHLRLTKRFHDAGVTILAGTDTARRSADIQAGEALHQELELLVEAGLTPYEALRAATVDAARYAGLGDRLGTIEEGKRADLVLLGANPLDDISHSQKIETVILAGRVLTRAEMKGMRESNP